MAALTVEQALQTAIAFYKTGQYTAAEAICRQILAAQPLQGTTLHLLAVIVSETGRYLEAVQYLSEAIMQYPTSADYHYDLGLIHQRFARPDEAIASYQRAISLKPDLCGAHTNLGNVFSGRDQWEEAIACHRRALTLEPRNAVIYSNLGAALKGNGEFHKALACYRQAVELDPEFPTAHWSLAGMLLLFGQYREGWLEHEWRAHIPNRPAPKRDFSVPRWPGGSLSQGTILVHIEEGYGDIIQFFRYVPLIRSRAGKASVMLECPKELTRMVEQTGGWHAEIVALKDWADVSSPPFTHYIPLLSLPLVLGLYEPLSMTHPYLRADPELCARWRERLAPNSPFRVGLVWAGRPSHSFDHRRSIPAETLLPLLGVPRVTFHSLQVRHPPQPPVELLAAGLLDDTTCLTDFAETAALIAQLDLVITVDTATAHLAGALGRPVWTLLPFVPDWRWGLEREDTPWYPTMRLFRQKAAGDWDEVVQRVVGELGAMCHSRAP